MMFSRGNCFLLQCTPSGDAAETGAMAAGKWLRCLKEGRFWRGEEAVFRPIVPLDNSRYNEYYGFAARFTKEDSMVQVIRSADRHHLDAGWLSTHWHFSFD